MFRKLLVFACACRAPSPAAPFAPDPIQTMGVAWKLRDASVVAVRPLAVRTPRDVQLVDRRDGYRWPAAWLTGAPHVVVHRDLLIIDDNNKRAVVALQMPRETDDHFVEHWTRPLREDEVVLGLAADDSRVYALLGEDLPSPGALAAFAVGTAVPAWRRDLPQRCQPVAIDAAGIAICRGTGAEGLVQYDDPWPAPALVLRFDPATGELGWEHAVDTANAVAADAAHVAIARPASLVILDARTGAARELAMPGIAAIALADDTAYVATPDRVAAIRLGTLAVAWSRPVPRTAQIAIADRALFVASEGSIVRALDRTSGELRWEYALDEDIALTVDGDRVYASGNNDTVTAFAPGAVPVAFEDAVVSGRVDACGGDPAGIVVAVGDVTATVASDGRFQIHIRARGALRVTAKGPLTWYPASIRLVRHGRYDAGVLTARCPKK